MKKLIDILREIREKFFPDIGGAIDSPDVRDLIDGLPSVVPSLRIYHNNFKVAEKEHLRLKNEPLVFPTQDRGGCTSWGYEIVKVCTSICTNCGIIKQDSGEQWSYQRNLYGASSSGGDTLLHALKVGKKYHQGAPISEYRKIPNNDLYHIKIRLMLGFCIYTGISWKKTPDGKSNTYKTSILTGAWSYFKTRIVGGHCIAVGGFDDEKRHLIAKESLRKWWGKNKVIGELYIPYDNVKNMMSMYIIKTTKVV